MLARTFLTAQQLGRTEKEFAALVDLLDRMERGELQHVSDHAHPAYYYDIPLGCEFAFNMETFGCGSVRCMAGWSDKLHNTNFVLYCSDPVRIGLGVGRRLYELFMGRDDANDYATEDMGSITVEQAAQALRNYLTTGRASWREVLAA